MQANINQNDGQDQQVPKIIVTGQFKCVGTEVIFFLDHSVILLQQKYGVMGMIFYFLSS